jgi:lysozyme
MARRGRKGRRRIGLYLGGLALLALCLAGVWGWWQAIHWMPDQIAFPVQGARISQQDGEVSFAALGAVGAQFVYLDASAGADGRDPAFSDSLDAARRAGLRTGAIHDYDPCIAADRQAANFITTVPRGGDLLPPAIALENTGSDCADPVSDAWVESELTTFLNQVESHSEQRAVLMLSPEFEDRFHLAARIERPLWLARNWREPDYAQRPWALWTANDALHSEAHEFPLRWVVVQP